LFITKKRYAILVFDKEGKRYDTNGSTGYVKAMGLDLRRSDTPKIVQDFLSRILRNLLDGVPRENIIQSIVDFKETFLDRPAWEKGTPKRVNNLTKFTKLLSKGKANLPGHVRASINWNSMRRMKSDQHSLEITDGQKVIVCTLKNNVLGYTSVSYPIDQTYLPDWFKELPFDENEMEAKIVDKKVSNLLGVLGWDLADTKTNQNTYSQLFG